MSDARWRKIGYVKGMRCSVMVGRSKSGTFTFAMNMGNPDGPGGADLRSNWSRANLIELRDLLDAALKDDPGGSMG